MPIGPGLGQRWYRRSKGGLKDGETVVKLLSVDFDVRSLLTASHISPNYRLLVNFPNFFRLTDITFIYQGIA